MLAHEISVSWEPIERSVWRQVLAGWLSHVAGGPGGAASTDFLHQLEHHLLV
jgi:hypothetical protein